MEELEQAIADIWGVYKHGRKHIKWEGDLEDTSGMNDWTEEVRATAALISQATKAARRDEVKLWMSKRLEEDYNSSMYGIDRLASLTKED